MKSISRVGKAKRAHLGPFQMGTARRTRLCPPYGPRDMIRTSKSLYQPMRGARLLPQPQWECSSAYVRVKWGWRHWNGRWPDQGSSSAARAMLCDSAQFTGDAKARANLAAHAKREFSLTIGRIVLYCKLAFCGVACL